MKEKMITRTITTSKVNALCMDISDIGNPVSGIQGFTVPGYTESLSDTLKACKELFENDTLKVVAIVNYEKVETLYGMPECLFIANATILPPRSGAKADE